MTTIPITFAPAVPEAVLLFPPTKRCEFCFTDYAPAQHQRHGCPRCWEKLLPAYERPEPEPKPDYWMEDVE